MGKNGKQKRKSSSCIDLLCICKSLLHNINNNIWKEINNIKKTVDELKRTTEIIKENLDNSAKQSPEIDSLREENERLTEELDGLKKEYEKAKEKAKEDNESLTQEKQSLTNDLGNEKKRFEEEQKNHENEIKRLKNEKDEEMCELLKRIWKAITGKDDNDKVTKEELEQKINELKGNIESKETQISDLKDTVKDKETQISELNNKNDSLEKAVKKMKLEISDLKGTVEKRDSEISELNGIVSDYEKCEIEYTDAITPFLDIFRLMQKCPSMQSVIEEQFDLPMEGQLSISQQIQFANCFSDKTYCAGLVYESMKQYKKEHDEPITDNELALVNTLNEYYKNLFGIEEDILDCLSIEGGTEFNAGKMKLITDPNNTWLSRVNYLCVPALRNQDSLSEFAQKALIMGE